MRFPRLPCFKQFLQSILPRLPRVALQTLIPRRIATTSAKSRTPVDVPKLIVAPGSPNHNSLSSFLEYVERKGLNTKSTVYVGTHYEYTVLESLRRIGFSLFRTGGRADRGIDLLGHWVLPCLREPMRVIVQCKAMSGPCNPMHIRELEGSFLGMPADWRNKDVLGLLVTTQNATKGLKERLGASRMPLGYIKVSKGGIIEQYVYNSKAEERGLQGVGVTVRYTPLVTENNNERGEDEDLPEIINGKRRRKKRKAEKYIFAGVKKDIQLTWQGDPMFPELESMVEETIKLQDMISHDLTALPQKSMGKSSGRPLGAKTGAMTKPKTTRSTTKKPTATKRAPTKKVVKKKTTTSTPLTKAKSNPTVKKPTTSVRKDSPPPKPRGRPKGSKNKVKVAINMDPSSNG
jgi:hypothetical protein